MAGRQGVAVHDFWKPDYRCGGRHALCNAHLLRDLTGLYEVTGESWVAQLGDLLVDMHRAASAARDRGHDHVAPDRYTSYHALYDTLVHHGRQRHPEPESRTLRAPWAQNEIWRRTCSPDWKPTGGKSWPFSTISPFPLTTTPRSEHSA